MQLSIYRVRAASLGLLLLFALILSAGCHHSAPAMIAAPPRPLNMLQRHPTLTSLGAGYAAYKAAKITGQNREAAGGRKNFAQRHPILTGVAAAALTHHIIKKSIHN